MIDLYFLIPAVTAQIFNPTAKLVTCIGMSAEEGKAETEINPVTAEAKIRKCSVYKFRVVQTFLCFLLINSY